MRPRRYHTDDDEQEDEIERILREQETHELTCPVCDSRVTRGLIIPSRKRRSNSISEDPHRLAKARRNCEEAINSLILINRAVEVYDVQERSQQSQSSSPTTILDVDTDPEDEECWGCASCFPCFSFFHAGEVTRIRETGKFERHRSMRDAAAADYGPNDLTPLLRKPCDTHRST